MGLEEMRNLSLTLPFFCHFLVFPENSHYFSSVFLIGNFSPFCTLLHLHQLRNPFVFNSTFSAPPPPLVPLFFHFPRFFLFFSAGLLIWLWLTQKRASVLNSSVLHADHWTSRTWSEQKVPKYLDTDRVLGTAWRMQFQYIPPTIQRLR